MEGFLRAVEQNEGGNEPEEKVGPVLDTHAATRPVTTVTITFLYLFSFFVFRYSSSTKPKPSHLGRLLNVRHPYPLLLLEETIRNLKPLA